MSLENAVTKKGENGKTTVDADRPLDDDLSPGQPLPINGSGKAADRNSAPVAQPMPAGGD